MRNPRAFEAELIAKAMAEQQLKFDNLDAARTWTDAAALIRLAEERSSSPPPGYARGPTTPPTAEEAARARARACTCNNGCKAAECDKC